ncbi:hypothetical protein skT53_25210 [Effusibacillus dendaii]|uniref:Uncharacterized protein n=1 Tax=Effusibacillus dendaii TaxID=2743772 RepID=A0A7I8DF96_9BACL|nr:hypothetical protein skT53_25210 [Effusibacillus dendaii]
MKQEFEANRIVIKNGNPLLEGFPSWEWNQPGNVEVLQSVLGYEIDATGPFK